MPRLGTEAQLSMIDLRSVTSGKTLASYSCVMVPESSSLIIRKAIVASRWSDSSRKQLVIMR